MANPTHKSAEEVFEQPWLDEARRRSQLRVEGKTRAISGEDFFAELRQWLLGSVPKI